MGAYPASVSTFTVVGRLWVDEGDGADGDADPDVNPQEGVSVTFTPQLNPKRIRVPGFGLVDIEPVAAVTDADGYVKTLNGEAVVLAYGGDPDITPTGWTWLVSIEATSVVPEDEFSIAGSAGGTVDLSEFASVSPADPGAEVVAWVSARDAAIAAKDDAEAAQAAAETAQAAAEAAQAAAEAVPTSNDAIVAALLEDGGSATRVAANAAYADKATQTTVESGRLSETNLAGTIRGSAFVSRLWALRMASGFLAGTATRSAMGASLSGNDKWYGGVLGPDGKIYGIPRNATDILVIDPVAGTATRSAMGASLSGNDKWVGGVLGPDGKIYGIPMNASDILVTSHYLSAPVGDIAISPYLNKF